MEHIVVEWAGDGYWLDPRPFLDALPVLRDRLPIGARRFVDAPKHYDFSSDECVKDLWFESLTVNDADSVATVSFQPNTFKHPVGLTITYSGIRELVISRPEEPGVGWLGSVLLDELLPTSGGGVSHELALTGGTLRIEAADLHATWRANAADA